MVKNMVWKVAEAKNRFSELLDTVDEDGPQEIQRRGKTYVVSARPYGEGERNRLVEIITGGPSWEDLDTDGIPGKMRNVPL